MKERFKILLTALLQLTMYVALVITLVVLSWRIINTVFFVTLIPVLIFLSFFFTPLVFLLPFIKYLEKRS